MSTILLTAKPSARFERTRCTIARRLYRPPSIRLRLVLLLVPNDHPWNIYTRSALIAYNDLTKATLRPRGPNGKVVARVPKLTRAERKNQLPV